jgi:hypothetical protein
MAGDHNLSPPTEASRKFLETFLEQVRGAGMPGAPELIAKIERALAPTSGLEAPPDDSPGESGDRCTSRD